LAEGELFAGNYPELIHGELEGCRLYLRDGARGQLPDAVIIEKHLAQRMWHVINEPSGHHPNHFTYGTHQPDAGLPFIMRLSLPLDGTVDEQQACQLAGEQVIDTFRLVPPPPPPIVATPPVICRPLEEEAYRCHDQFLDIEFTYPMNWGELRTSFSDDSVQGNVYSYHFANAIHTAGGRNIMFGDGKYSPVWTDFSGYPPGQLQATCEQYSAAFCEEVKPGVLLMLQRTDAATICQAGAWGVGFSAFIAINLPEHEQITGFIFPLPLFPERIMTELGWLLSRAEPSTDCQRPEQRATFDQRIDELFSEFTNRTTLEPDAWYAPVLQLAESIVIHL
jgi:hypothetical protein